MSECTNTDAGLLLHAYELRLLSEEETERFMLHCLDCEHCFTKVKEFELESELVNTDSDIRQSVIDRARKSRPEPERTRKNIWDWLWPAGPLVLKPALLYALILLLFLPAYQGFMQWRQEDTPGIRSVQSISLFPVRSARTPVLHAGTGNEGLVKFVMPGAIAGESYQVLIESEDGAIIFSEEDFTGFDEHETGQLLLPLASLRPGTYRLKIVNPRKDPPYDTREYGFLIEP